MIDWKILSSAIIALLVVSFILIEVLGSGALSNVFGALGDWFRSSPFGGIFSSPKTSIKPVAITIYSQNLTINPDGDTDIEAGMMNFTAFRGTIGINLKNSELVLAAANSDMKAKSPLAGLVVSRLRIDSLSVSGVRFMVEPNTTAENGTISIFDFYGSATVKEGGLELRGNVSKLTAKIGDLNWEIS